jgi:hypothetical protein
MITHVGKRNDASGKRLYDQTFSTNQDAAGSTAAVCARTCKFWYSGRSRFVQSEAVRFRRQLWLVEPRILAQPTDQQGIPLHQRKTEIPT